MAKWTPKCQGCGCNLPRSVARTYDGQWWCSDCTLTREAGRELDRIPPAPKVDKKHPQKETLFDVRL